jgi:hypothetical protein
MVDWTRPLTRVLILKTGEHLRTLHDATELITRRFGSVTKLAPVEQRTSPSTTNAKPLSPRAAA